MFYIWEHDFKYPAPDDVVIPKEWNEYDLFGGNRIRMKKLVPPMQLRFDREVILSDSIPSRHILLFFGERLVEFINRDISRELIQSFPIEIQFTASHTKMDNYFVINVVNLKDVIDRDASDLLLSKHGNINLIRRLQIREENANGCNLFRMEGSSSSLVCSQLFVDKLLEGRFSGMKFVPVNEFMG